MMPSADLRSRVLAAASREPAPVRAQLRRRHAILLGSALVVPTLWFLAFGGLRQAGRPSELVVETAAVAALIAIVAAMAGLSRGRSMLGRPGSLLFAAALLTPALLFAGKVLVSSRYPSFMMEQPHRPGLRCLGLSCLMAAWPLVAFVLIRRGSDPTNPHLTGAAMGAAAGAGVWVLVDLWCPVAYVPHLLLGHVLPVMLTTAVGTLLGHRLIALRRA